MFFTKRKVALKINSAIFPYPRSCFPFHSELDTLLLSFRERERKNFISSNKGKRKRGDPRIEKEIDPNERSGSGLLCMGRSLENRCISTEFLEPWTRTPRPDHSVLIRGKVKIIQKKRKQNKIYANSSRRESLERN